MSKHNPFDDEEEFITEASALPPDADEYKDKMSMLSIMDDMNKKVREHFPKQHLSEITISFEYTNQQGFTSWVTTHYMRTDE